MNLLAIETSGDFLSLALSKADAIRTVHVPAGQRHAELALGAIDTLLREAGMTVADLEGIAYGEGPGSFTGLRIACSLAQGLAFAKGLPVVGVGTLEALAEAAGDDAVYACIDARMSEVYCAAYRRGPHGLREVIGPALRRPQDVPVPQGADWSGCGSGFGAYGESLSGALADKLKAVRADVSPTAEAMLRLAKPRFERGETKDAAGAVPIYLRDKVALKTSER